MLVSQPRNGPNAQPGSQPGARPRLTHGVPPPDRSRPGGFGQNPWGQPPIGQQRPPAGQRPGQTNGRQPSWAPPGPGQSLSGLRIPPPSKRPNPLILPLLALLAVGVIGFIATIIIASSMTQHSTTTGGDVSSSGYQNEDYQVPPAALNPPPLPQPQTYSEARDWLTENAIYAGAVDSPVRCKLQELDLRTASNTRLTIHMNQMTECLMRVWGPPLEAAGFTPVRPSVTVYDGPVTTACGQLPNRNAVYCAADQQVYYAQDLPTVVPQELLGTQFITESIIAHEFGHAIQARTGILISNAAWEQQSSEQDALSLSRRLEMQADCFAGEFLSAVSESTSMQQSDLNSVGRLFYSFGDDVLRNEPGSVGNHGQGTNRQSWMSKGLSSPQIVTCNTFTADEQAVR